MLYSESIVDSIIIGLTIEAIDIYDLEHLISETDNDDIILVSANLRDTSIKHLQTFDRQLNKYYGSYTAQFISKEFLNELLNK